MSMLWQGPPTSRLICQQDGICNVHDACQYNAPRRKRTRVACRGFTHHVEPNHKCTGLKGLCSKTGKHHIVLKGTDPVSKRLWTKVAEPYPRHLCKLYALFIVKYLVRARPPNLQNLLK